MTIVFHRLPWIIRFNDFNEKQISKLNSDFYFKDIHGKDFKRSQYCRSYRDTMTDSVWDFYIIAVFPIVETVRDIPYSWLLFIIIML